MWEKGRQDTHTELRVGPGTCVEELVVPGSPTAAGRLYFTALLLVLWQTLLPQVQ